MNHSERLKDISNVFSVFHDGGLTLLGIENTDLRLQVDCEYLSALINPDYTNFTIVIHGLRTFYWEPWTLPEELPQIRVNDIDIIFKTELEISASEVQAGIIMVCCLRHDDPSEVGGYLYIDCDAISTYDQSGSELTAEELRQLSYQYWSKFGLK